MNTAVCIKQMSKTIKNIDILKNINMKCAYGEIYGIIGRNGSGKSMLFKAICGLVIPSDGEIEINNKLIKKGQLAEDIGVIIENPGFILEYTGFKNLKLLASINNKINDDDIKRAITKVGLDPDDRKKVKNYSLGMKQRLGIAQAIMEEPKVLILDEPFNGLDSEAVKEIRVLLSKLKLEGKCILLTSHNKEDIDILCNKVFAIDNGILEEVV